MATITSDPTASKRYSAVAITLHWLIALFIVLQILGGWAMEDLEGQAKFQAFQVHKSSGLTILLLSVARLAWRLTHRPPPLPTTMKTWEVAAATFVHTAFYVLIIVIPLTGWIMISTSPYTVATQWWGLFEWPKLPLGDLPFRKALNEGANSAHSALVWATIGLWVVHVAAALKHQFVDDDDVLARMIPFIGRKD